MANELQEGRCNRAAGRRLRCPRTWRSQGDLLELLAVASVVHPAQPNVDEDVVRGFGVEWSRFNQTRLDTAEHRSIFDHYFASFDFAAVRHGVGADVGCGSGRWARLVAPRVGHLHCIDPSPHALDVARTALRPEANVSFHSASISAAPIEPASLDFAFCLGVIHHTPDPEASLRSVAAWLKPGAQLLLYAYYRLDNRPRWFRALWRASDLIRRAVSRLPVPLRLLVSEVVAAAIYFPLARAALALEKCGFGVGAIPLSHYRRLSFYTMRTDALDRLGTRIEHRFTRAELGAMLERCGFEDIRFNPGDPYWVAQAIKGRG